MLIRGETEFGEYGNSLYYLHKFSQSLNRSEKKKKKCTTKIFLLILPLKLFVQKSRLMLGIK